MSWRFWKKEENSEEERKSLKNTIENVNDPHKEHAYVRFPGKEIVDITSKSTEGSYSIDSDKFLKLKEEHYAPFDSSSLHVLYTHIHTHPTTPINFTAAIPSKGDFSIFLGDDDYRKMVIAQTDSETGELQGVLELEKTEKTPSLAEQINKKRILDKYNRIISTRKNGRSSHKDSFAHYNKALRALANIYHLNYEFIPEAGYQLNKDEVLFERTDKQRIRRTGELEGIASITATIISLILGLFFLSPNFTGNAIFNFSSKTSNGMGYLLFIIGLIGLFYYFRRKSK